MVNALDSSQRMSVLTVDPDWYRETYPDVAQAGMDPVQHYLQHGRQEGRFPRLLQSLRLEQALWGGFSQRAIPALRDWYKTCENDAERAYAGWALARWYASERAWDDALPYIDALRQPLLPFLCHPGVALLGVEVLSKTGHIEDAQRWLQSCIASQPGLPDWALAAANVRLSRSEPYLTEDDLRLAWLNSVWEGAGLAAVGKKDPGALLGLDNLGPVCRYARYQGKQAKITVLMPAFNASEWIGTALQGLLDQTWENLEIIVIDDVSSDDTAARVRHLASHDPRIVLLQHQENQGAYAARNFGLQHATGEFITNHDSDDWSHPERLERMVQPLLNDATLIATVADWVRVDQLMHFQAWRIEQGIIGPSVSTLLCRRRALMELGGWDNVRVAADFELHQRLQQAYGMASVVRVLPGVPLVLARQIDGSLTTTPATHLRTMFFGVRRLYQDFFETWHAMAAGARGLRLSRQSGARPFPAPQTMLHGKPKSQQYDWLLMADLSIAAAAHDKQVSIVQKGFAAGKNIALFHWPEFGRPAQIAPYFLSRALEKRLDIVLADQNISAERVFVIDKNLLQTPPDRLPEVSFERSHVISVNDKDFGAFLRGLQNEGPPALESKPDGFDADWYLYRNPDVKASGIDPWEHYLAHGAAEGREPSPHFNTPHYVAQCPAVKESGMPALLHYLKVGQALGHTPAHPVFDGDRAPCINSPTLLLCGHIAGEELFGAERSLVDVLEACLGLRMNVLVTVPSVINQEYIAALRSKSHKVLCVPTTLWQAGVPPCPYAIEQLVKIIRQEAVDIVQSNTIMLREPLLAAGQTGVRALVHAHEVPDDDELCQFIGLDAEQIRRQVIQSSDALLANSRFTAARYCHPNTFVVGGNLADLDALDIPNVVPPTGVVAGLISSNQPKKGLNDFVKLARMLAEQNSTVQLRLIGPENEHARSIRNAVDDGRLPKNITVVGYAATPKKAVEQCNIVLSLSHCQETFGRTVLEAMAARRPVVGYVQGAIPELVSEGRNGFLADVGDVGKIADRLICLSQNPDLITAMGRAGRQASARHTVDPISRAMSRVYLATDE